MLWRAALLFAVVTPAIALGQKPPKIDSLYVELRSPKAEALDAVLAAFAAARLDVTDQTPSLVTADLGSTRNDFTGIRFDRVVRALLTARGDSATGVLLTGDERRTAKDGRMFKRLRIDNRAGGAGEQAWCQMVLVALALDSTQVSEDQRKAEGCAERMR